MLLTQISIVFSACFCRKNVMMDDSYTYIFSRYL